jgi:hypothetical protein
MVFISCGNYKNLTGFINFGGGLPDTGKVQDTTVDVPIVMWLSKRHNYLQRRPPSHI